MSSFLKVVSGAEVAPVGLTDALRHIRALENDADMVWTYLQGATALVEDYTGRSLVTKTFALTLSSWPDKSRVLELRRSPLLAISSVKYYAEGASVQTTLSSAEYLAITGRLPGAIQFLDTLSFPALAVREDAVTVEFTAGYGTAASAMPAELRVAILMLTHHWFDERTPFVGAKSMEMPFSLRTLLRAFRVDATLTIP